MKLKYQMRGLGLGIIVTALLMGVATGKGIPLSDAEIKAKALELGMVESDAIKLTDLVDTSQMPEEGDSLPGNGEGQGTALGEGENPDGLPVTGNPPGGGSASVPGGQEESGTSPEPAAGPAGEESPEPGAGSLSGEDGSNPTGEAVTVVIEFGVTSAHVSEILKEAGLVEDAATFDAYLCNNGYSRKITAGTYEIVPGTSEEEIIEIITQSR